MLCSCDALAASAPAKDSAPPSQGAHKQGLKRRHLRAEGVIFLGVCVEQPSDGRQHFIATGGQHSGCRGDRRGVRNANRRANPVDIRCRRRQRRWCGNHV